MRSAGRRWRGSVSDLAIEPHPETWKHKGLLRIVSKTETLPGGCRLRKIWVDAGYGGEGLRACVRGLKRTHTIDLEVTDHQGKGFQLVPKRWVVERTFGW